MATLPYDTDAGEFVDFETLDDWRERDEAKDAEITRLRAALDAMTKERDAAMQDAQVRKWGTNTSPQLSATRADAQLTPAQAMARCPAVSALVVAGRLAETQIEASGGDGLASGLTAALAPFTEGPSNG